jgi:hypothetical protein
MVLRPGTGGGASQANDQNDQNKFDKGKRASLPVWEAYIESIDLETTMR